MKILLFLFSIFFFNKLIALEISCYFEEVYQNGHMQQGTFIMKHNKSRYQYESENLYTIIYAKNDMHLVSNLDKKLINYQKKQKNLFDQLIKASSEFPNIKEEYTVDDYKIKVEKNDNENFIRRLSITSEVNLNLSIYFYDCKQKEIYDIYFHYYPFFEYKH